MSDSDSSSDESSGDGIEIMISNLESSDYDGHLKIIAKCKKEGELDFLRNGLLVNQVSSLVDFISLPITAVQTSVYEGVFFIHLRWFLPKKLYCGFGIANSRWKHMI